MARIDQITFGGEDASWLSNLNSDFINMVSPFSVLHHVADEGEMESSGFRIERSTGFHPTFLPPLSRYPTDRRGFVIR